MMRPYYEDKAAGIVLYHCRAEELLATLEPQSVDLVLTDPPYAVSVAGSVHVGQKGKGQRRLDFFPQDDDWQVSVRLAVETLRNAVPLLTAKGSIYAWLGHRQFGPVVEMLEVAGFQTRFLVWAKECPPPPPPGAGWPSGAELCVYAYRSGREWTHRGKETPRSNVLMADSYRYGQPGKVAHPTQKPLEVVVPLIEASSRMGDLICDPFLGSGTTARACKDLGRRFVGCDINRDYLDIAVQRLAQEVMPMWA